MWYIGQLVQGGTNDVAFELLLKLVLFRTDADDIYINSDSVVVCSQLTQIFIQLLYMSYILNEILIPF